MIEFWSVSELPSGKSKGRLAEDLYGGQTYDCALPQSWVDGMVDALGLPADYYLAGQFVWLYAEEIL